LRTHQGESTGYHTLFFTFLDKIFLMPSAVEQSLRSFKQKVKSATGGSFWLRYLTLAPYRALCAGAAALTGLTRSGARHADSSVTDAIQHINSIFREYRAAARLDRFYGRVAEVGPGDSCGIGLMFLADGCEQVDLVDRFFSARDERQQEAINRALVDRLPQLAALRKNGDFSESSFTCLTRHYGQRAAAETFFEAHKDYDFIVSCAVLEHAYDPLRAVDAMASALKPGGMMLHVIDCRDHGQFSEQFHELKFLQLPAPVYSPLKWSGGLNRVRLGGYLSTLQNHGLSTTVYVMSLAGVREEMPLCTKLEDLPPAFLAKSRNYVSEVKQQLAKPFRDMPDEELMTTRFMLVARKQPTSV
jgi:SAM-dependent methyltransferase